MDILRNQLEAVALGDRVQPRTSPPGAHISSFLDVHRLLIAYINRTIRFIAKADRPSVAVGLKMKRLYTTLLNYCRKIGVPDIFMLAIFASYSIFSVFWKRFQLAEKMPQFGRPIRGVLTGVPGYRKDPRVSKIVCLDIRVHASTDLLCICCADKFADGEGGFPGVPARLPAPRRWHHRCGCCR